MKKVLFTLICLAATFATGIGLKAQEVTITLWPGWNWISYPNAEVMQVEEALGDFVPMNGDMILSQFSNSTYVNNRWRGGVTQFMPGWGYMYYSARNEIVEFVFAQTSDVSVTTTTPTDITATSAVVGGSMMLPEGSHVFLRGVCWGTEPNPDIDGNHTSDGTDIGSFSSTLEGLNPSTIYYVRAYVVSDYGLAYGNEVNFTTEAGGSDGDHDYVDLGLPSGLLWATCNIGADAPEDYGDYFAWSETQPKDTYDWSTYQYCNGSDNTLTKYCNNSSYGYNGFTDNMTTLLPEDDAATANWGTEWRMPTKAEWQELYNNTTCTWTQQNGVNGRLFTASNGNSLFLPAAGYRRGSSLYYAGGYGIYWSSSLNTGSPYYVWLFGFYSDYYGMDDIGRSYGHSVRAVRSSAQNNTPTGALDGKFTINANGDQVYFSQGNLQYQASTGIWRFAENQWNYSGYANRNISPTYDGWIDLFGWGTSGFNHGAVCYQPWSTSKNTSDYYAYGSSNNNLCDQTGQADWGYNAISNGGNNENSGWRTLTNDEWGYVFNTRTTTSGIRYAKANVNELNGVILLPDNWTTTTYTLDNTNNSGAAFTSNTITAADWTDVLEANGAVFLPAAGDRDRTTVYSVDSYGTYWSASYSNNYYACTLYFYSDNLSTNYGTRDYGQSVRLVHNVE